MEKMQEPNGLTHSDPWFSVNRPLNLSNDVRISYNVVQCNVVWSGVCANICMHASLNNYAYIHDHSCIYACAISKLGMDQTSSDFPWNLGIQKRKGLLAFNLAAQTLKSTKNTQSTNKSATRKLPKSHIYNFIHTHILYIYISYMCVYTYMYSKHAN